MGTRPVIAVVQARMTSSRLPNKVFKPLAGAPLIVRVVERAQRILGVDGVVVAIAEGMVHDPIVEALRDSRVLIVRGSELDVLERTAIAARATNAGTIVRLTSDNPLIDPSVSAAVLAAYLASHPVGTRYARTALQSGFPYGFDTEVVDAQALYEAEREATEAGEREHVTPFIRNRPERFPSVMLETSPDHRHWRLTVDTEEDYLLAAAVYDELFPRNPTFGYADLRELFATRPELLAINKIAK